MDVGEFDGDDEERAKHSFAADGWDESVFSVETGGAVIV